MTMEARRAATRHAEARVSAAEELTVQAEAGFMEAEEVRITDVFPGFPGLPG
jgi:hypothetical protein